MIPSNRALSESSEVSVNSLTFNLTKAQEYFDEHKFADLGGTCTFYSEIDSSGCYKPRSCSDCLVRSECMINEFGVCVNREFDGYNESMDFHLAQKQGLVMPPTEPSIANVTQSWHFLQSDVDYCWEADPMCKQCREANFWFPGGNNQSDSRYCLGQGGCVCIWSCESPARKNYLPADCWARDEEAFSDEYDPSPSSSSSLSTGGIIGIALGSIAFFVLVICVANGRNEKKRRAAREQEQGGDPSTSKNGAI